MTRENAKRTGTLRLPAGTLGRASDKIYGLLVADNDLAPRFCRGDTVIADPNVPPKPGDHVVLWPTDAQGTPSLHQLAPTGSGADKAETGVTMHKVVGVYRPE
jgi:SOS-response transcriptional repressor LexA